MTRKRRSETKRVYFSEPARVKHNIDLKKLQRNGAMGAYGASIYTTRRWASGGRTRARMWGRRKEKNRGDGDLSHDLESVASLLCCIRYGNLNNRGNFKQRGRKINELPSEF